MKKQPLITLGLYVTEKAEHGFYHLHASGVVVGPTLWELRYREPHNVPADRIRNCSGSGSDDGSPLYLENLSVWSQGDHHGERRLYGWSVEYRDVFSVDAHKAKRMANTLQTITRRMEKADQQYGRPTTFGAYVARVARAIGATILVFPPKDRRSSHDDNQHTFDSIRDGAYRIDRTVQAWTDAGKPEQVTA